MYSRFKDYLLLMRLHRPIGIFLLLWPTLWALWFAADGTPPFKVLLVFIVGTVLMRSAGCAINDYADREIDPHVARTRERPLAAGRITPDEALRLFVAVSLIAFGLLTSLHSIAAILLAIPAALLAASYPFMKRWISIPQAYLGIAFSWGIPMAYVVLRPQFPWCEMLLLVAANLMWVIAYDTQYAMVDRDDDLRIGVKSSAIWFGRHDRLIVALLHAASLALLLILGLITARGGFYFAGLCAAAGFAVYQYVLTRSREPAICFRAFLNNNYFGLSVFLGLLLDRLV